VAGVSGVGSPTLGVTLAAHPGAVWFKTGGLLVANEWIGRSTIRPRDFKTAYATLNWAWGTHPIAEVEAARTAAGLTNQRLRIVRFP
jgi:hypothetical protein